MSYFGTMMVHMGDADGARCRPRDRARNNSLLQIIKTAPASPSSPSIFLMAMKDRVWAFGDCAISPNPTPSGSPTSP